jgi:hypothetical protein
MSLKKKKKKTLRPSSRFRIEHLIENPDGSLRPVRPEDLYIDNHPGVRAAFRMIYEWQKEKDLETKRKEIIKDATG